MAQPTQNIIIRFTSDVQQALGGIKQLEDQVDALKKTFGLAADAAALFGVSLGIREVMDMADSMVQLDNKLRSLTTSTAEYEYASQAVVAIATQTNSSIDDVGKAYGRLEVTMRMYGYEQETITNTLQTFIEYQKASGASTAMMERGMNDLVNALERGGFQWRDIRQLMVQAPEYMAKLREALGMTAEEFQVAAITGQITTNKIVDAMKKMKDEADNLQDGLRHSFTDGMTQFKNAIELAIGSINKATGASELFYKMAKLMSDNVGILIGAIAGLTIGIGALLAVLFPAAAAMTVLTGGVALLGALAGGALGLLAQKMGLFGDKTSEAAEKAKALAAALPKDDPKSIRTEQADRAVLSYMRQLEVLQQMAPIEADRYKNGVLDYEIQKSITTENAKLLELGTQLTDKEKQKAIAAITTNTLAKESGNVQKTILDLSNQITENGIVDTDERKIQVEMDKMKLQYSTQTYEKYKDQVAALMRQNELIQAQTKLAEAVKTTPSVSEMGTQGASILQSDTTTGIIAQQQRTMATLDFLKQQGYLKDKQYADLQIQAEADKNAAILALDQKLMDSQMKLAGVTNQAIVTAVKDQMANIQMIQQGGIAGIQGMLGGLDNVFASLGTYNREAFEAHKSLATAMALISTYQAVATSLATIPWPFSLVAAAGAFAAGMAQVSAIQSQTYTGKAIGGPVSNTQSYLVGENGPEIFTPSQNGTITPNKDMKDSGTTNINFNIQANDAQGFDDLLVQRKGMVTQMVRDAIAEQGQRIRI